MYNCTCMSIRHKQTFADFYFIARYMYRQDTQVYGAHTALWVKWVVTKCVVNVAPSKCETLFTLVFATKVKTFHRAN